MVGSSLGKRWSRRPQGLLTVPLVVVYLAFSALSAHAGIDAMTHVLESIEQASSDPPSSPDSAVSLGGDLFP
jgi:hypothetical protein